MEGHKETTSFVNRLPGASAMASDRKSAVAKPGTHDAPGGGMSASIVAPLRDSGKTIGSNNKRGVVT